MKVKIEKVIEGDYGYDSVITEINKIKTDIVFDKKENVKQYEGKLVEFTHENDTYKISEINVTKEIKK